VSMTATLATCTRVLLQLRRDRRTIGLVLVLPPVLLALFKYAFDAEPGAFQLIAPALVGLFPFTIMFLITSIAMLRERTGGTLERLMSLPLAKLDLLLGYALAFAIVATLQAALASAVAVWLLDLNTQGPAWQLVILAVANAILGMALGLFFSAFARSEFQAVQFMPAVVFPQVFLAGLFVPREDMARVLQLVSNVLPLTYSYDALARVTRGEGFSSDVARDTVIIIGAILLALLLGAATLRRRTS
jgi:ABC-2 type transport system permease protein